MSAGRKWLTSSSSSGGTSCPASALLQLKGGSRSWSRLLRPAHPPSRPRGRGRRGGSARLQNLPRAAALVVDSGAVLGQGDLPVVVPSGVFGRTVQKLRVLRSCSSSLVVIFPFVPHTPIPMVLLHSRSWKFHNCCLFWWSLSLLCWVVQVLRCCSEKPLSLPQLQLVEKSVTFLRLNVFGSHLFGVRLRSTGFWTLLGDDFLMFPVVSAFLVQHWIHALRQSTELWTCTMLVLLVTMSLALCFLLCLQAQDARLLGRHVQFLDKVLYMPVVVLRVVYWSRQCSIGGSRSCSSSRSLVLPVVMQRQIRMILVVQITIEITQSQLIDNVAHVLVVHVVQVPQVQVVLLTCFPSSWCR